MTSEEKYMLRALELAELGRGSVSPNPMVGCVIVKDDRIIGEGWHRKYGEAHAEVNAINSIRDKSLLAGAEVYVSLEPCAHFGKTPPCADLLAQYPIKRVIVAMEDPYHEVAGKGLEKLQTAGIEVVTGVLNKEAEALNRSFLTAVRKKRPYIILKWAQTADGFIAREDGSSKWISGNLSRKLVHKWRSEEDAVLVGRMTAEADNPQLTVRDWSGRDPLRIVIDSQLKLQSDLNLFDGSAGTLIYNCLKNEVRGKNIFIKLNTSADLIEEILNDLYERKVRSVIVEGGTKVLTSFLKKNSWDEIRLFKSRQAFGAGIPAPLLSMLPEKRSEVQEDILEIFYNKEGSGA